MAARFSAIDERAAARGHHGVPQRQQRPDDLPLDRTEVRLSLAGEDLRHRSPLARLDEQVDVFGAPSEAAPERLRQCGFSGSHESDQIDLVRLQGEDRHDGSHSDSSVEKNSG